MSTLATTSTGAVDLVLEVRDQAGTPVPGLVAIAQVRDSAQRLLDWTARNFGAGGNVAQPLTEQRPGVYASVLSLAGMGLPPGSILWADYYVGSVTPRLVATDLVVVASAGEASQVLVSAGLTATPPARAVARAFRASAPLAGFASASVLLVGVRTVRTSLAGILHASEPVSGEPTR